MDDIHSGGCLCGAVRFRARGPLRGVIFCHCGQCRRQSGHIFAATNVPTDRLQVAGACHLTWYRSSDMAERGFCRICGSALFWKRGGVADISVMAGAFDAPGRLKAEAHIFVADKADYYDIGDALPQHARSMASVKVAGD